jgi:uncharacterized membrane protein YvbJ
MNAAAPSSEILYRTEMVVGCNMEKFCFKCGAQLPDPQARFCKECGANLIQPVPKPEPIPQTTITTRLKNLSSKTFLLWILGSVVI